MIKLSKAISSRTLFLLISFALFCFLPGCGGSGTSTSGEVATTYTLTLDTDFTSLKAGETATITATVSCATSSSATSCTSSGVAVDFTALQNNSGGTLTIQGTGTTDTYGKAQATFTAGSTDPSSDVQDLIQASVPGSTQTVTITRSGLTYTLTVTPIPDITGTFKAGETVTLKALVTSTYSHTVSGYAVDFSVVRNNSGGTLAIQGTGITDANGEAQATYTLGSNNPSTQVDDLITVSIPPTPGVSSNVVQLTITRVAGSAVQPSAASLDLAASPTSIKTDNVTTSTITVNALSAGNALLSGVTVNLSTDTGVLSAASVTTDTTTPATVKLSCGDSDKANRTATITATSGTVTAQIPVQITGSKVTLASDKTSLSTGASATLTVTVKDAGSNAISGATVSLAQSGSGSVTFGSATGTTDNTGQFTTTATGNTNGSVTITASALGETATSNLTINQVVATFGIDKQWLNAVDIGNPKPTGMRIGDSLAIEVNAPPPTTHVIFATTTGVWNGTTSAVKVDVVAGKATATLTTTQAGLATIQVYDPDNLDPVTQAIIYSDILTVGMTSVIADRITLQATPTVVSRGVGSTNGVSTLIAMVRDSSGFPVGNAQVAFSIVNPTGGGETISPVMVPTATTTANGLNLGEARTSFTSGSLASGSTGVQIRASVVGILPAITTGKVGGVPPPPANAPPSANSGPDATIVIGGTAGSVAFGVSSVINYYDDTQTSYKLGMSILVSDSDGNPAPEGTIISLSTFPIGWSTGGSCVADADGWAYNSVTKAFDIPCPKCGTFWNEDVNENQILDAGEDGARNYYYLENQPGLVHRWGSKDGKITAVNSGAGTVPATVITDKNGVADFDLVYPLPSSIWTVARVRASTIVLGTETVGQVIFTLPPMCSDTPCGGTCRITGSPYTF